MTDKKNKAGRQAAADAPVPAPAASNSATAAASAPVADEPAAALESHTADAPVPAAAPTASAPVATSANLPQLEVGGSDVVPLARVTELAYAGAPEGSGVVVHVGGKQGSSSLPANSSEDATPSPTDEARDGASANTPSELLRIAVLLRPQVPMRQLVAVEPVAAMALLAAFEDAGVQADRIGIGWPHDIVLSEDNTPVATLSTKAGFSDGMFVSLAIDVQADVLASLLAEVGEVEAGVASTAADTEVAGTAATADATATSIAAADTAVTATTDIQALAISMQSRLVSAMREWELQAQSPNATAGPWAPFLPAYFDRVPLLGQAVNVCYPNGRLYARGIFVGIDIWGRATVRTRRAGDIEFPAQQFVIRPQSY
ncbi:MAG: hypothetical protein ACI360_08050 [Atopobiaceae bacterium]